MHKHPGFGQSGPHGKRSTEAEQAFPAARIFTDLATCSFSTKDALSSRFDIPTDGILPRTHHAVRSLVLWLFSRFCEDRSFLGYVSLAAVPPLVNNVRNSIDAMLWTILQILQILPFPLQSQKLSFLVFALLRWSSISASVSRIFLFRPLSRHLILSCRKTCIYQP